MRAASFSSDLTGLAACKGASGREHWESTLRGIVVIAVLSLVVLASYGAAAFQL